MMMKSPSTMHLLPTGGFKRCRFSSIQRCRSKAALMAMAVWFWRNWHDTSAHHRPQAQALSGTHACRATVPVTPVPDSRAPVPHHRAGATSASLRDADVLGLGEEPEGVDPAFAAHARMLDPAKWGAQVAQHPTVDPHDAKVDARGDLVRAREIAGPHRRRESVIGVVGDRDGVVLVVEGDQRHHRAEDFLAVRRAMLRQTLDDRWRHEPAVGAAARHPHGLAARQYLAALVAGAGYARHH